MRVALFEPDWRSPISMLVALVTKSPWTHAAFEVGGTWYDASESRGDFNVVDIEESMKGRLAHIWTLPDLSVVEKFAKAHVGIPYDYAGVVGYLWSVGDARRFYCFEAVAAAIQFVYEKPIIILKLAGTDIQRYLGLPHEITRL